MHTLLCVHVDDGYIVSKSEGAIDSFIIDLMKEIHNATLYKPCQKYIGMEIIPDGNHVIVHQNTYIKSLNLHDITNDCHSEHIPMSNTMDLKDPEANLPNPQLSSSKTAKRTLRYLKSTRGNDSIEMFGFSDAYHITSGKASPDMVELSTLVLTAVSSGP